MHKMLVLLLLLPPLNKKNHLRKREVVITLCVSVPFASDHLSLLMPCDVFATRYRLRELNDPSKGRGRFTQFRTNQKIQKIVKSKTNTHTQTLSHLVELKYVID